MKNAFATEIRRSIRGSIGRFVAIAAIVALGSGFYAGLLTTPTDMNRAADAYFDDTGLMDVRVVSPLGLTSEDVTAIAGVEGVESVMPAYQTDAMVYMAGEEYATRVHSLPPAAASSDTSDGVSSKTSHPAYLNRPILVEGEWPDGTGECVLSADLVITQNVSIGDVVKIEKDSDEEATETEEGAAEQAGGEDLQQAEAAADVDPGALGEPLADDAAGTGVEAAANDAAGADVAAAEAAETDAEAAAAEADSSMGALDAEVTTPTFSYDDEADDMLASDTYTVVGFVSAPYYSVSSPMGTTALGSGSIQQFMYVPEADFTGEDLPYSEVFVTVSGARELDASSGAYERRVGEVVQGIEAIAPELAHARVESLRGEAQAELDDARAEYDRQKALADSKMQEVATELEDADTQIAENEQSLKDAQEKYDTGTKELEKKKKESEERLKEAEEALAKNEKELEAAKKQIDEASAQLDEGWKVYNDGASALNDAWQEWKSQADPFYENLKSAQDAVGELETQLETAEKNIQLYDDALAQNPSNAAELEAERAEYVKVRDDCEAALPAARKTLSDLQAQQGSIDSAKADLDKQQSDMEAAKAKMDEEQKKFEKANAEYNANVEQLAVGKRDLAAQKVKAETELEEAQKALDEAKKQIEDGKKELESAKDEVRTGKTDFEESKVNVNKQLVDAERELASAQQRIDDLEESDWYVLDRDENYGSASYQADADRIASIAAVFPLIFFLVAALVALTTMTRMVDEERQFIGTLKAIGYDRRKIATKYLVYAALASGLGAVVGILLLSEALPLVIMKSYAVMYFIPVPFPMPLDVPVALLAAGLGVGITLAATAAAAWKVLRERPALLMLPPAPKAGKRILLERTPLWKHLSFTWKVTLRNLFRYKRRFVMTVVGIAGCTALLLTGLGLSDSIGDILDKQYGEITKYNATITLDEDIIDTDRKSVDAVLHDSEMATAATDVLIDQMLASGPQASEKSFELVVPSDPTTFGEFFTMRTRIGHQEVELPENGFVLTEKIAKVLGVGVGDFVTLIEQDDVGNATTTSYSVQVTGVVENYLYNYGFMGPNLYKSTVGEAPQFDAIFAKATDNYDNRSLLTERLRDIPGVKTVLYNDETIDTYRTMLQTVNKVVIVLVLAAALLAFVVLYNLSNINITERIREIATLKVLGFTPGETCGYIYREIVLLAIIGALFGLLLGVGMESFVVVTAEVDQTMFGREIHLLSFVASFLLTLVFTGIVLLAMRRKISRVDMVESLKSNE